MVFTPFVGVYGISLLGYFWACALLLLMPNLQNHISKLDPIKLSISAFLAILSLTNTSLLIYQTEVKEGSWFTQPKGESLSFSLVQSNINQSIKFDPSYFFSTYDRYLSQIAPLDSQVIVLSETVLPVPWEETPSSIKTALFEKTQSGSSALILGAILNRKTEPATYHNSVITLGSASNPLLAKANDSEPILQTYHKIHLLPFGEVTPRGFEWFVKLLDMPYGEYIPGTQNQPPTQIRGTNIWVNICYELLFGEELAARTRQFSSEEPNIILNLSNFGWFGSGLALWQASYILEMRGHEMEMPIISATNTGPTISKINISSKMNMLPFATTNVLKVNIQGYSGQTLFSKLGNTIIYFLFLLLITPYLVIFFILRTKIGRKVQKNTKKP
jgi:apolipoprotein N-acyltransferase